MWKKQCILLVLTLFLSGLCACKAAEDTDRSGIVYVPKKINFTSDSAYLDGGCVIGENLYLLSHNEELSGDFGVMGQYSISRLPLDGGVAEEIASSQPFSEDSDLLSASIRAGTNRTICITEQIRNMTGSTAVFRQLDADGNEVFRYALGSLEAGTVSDLWRDGDGDIFVCCDKAVSVLDPSGTVQFSLQKASGEKFVVLSDGRVGLRTFGQDISGEVFTYLQVIDKTVQDWETYQLPPNCAVYTGKGADLFYYVEGDILNAWREGKGEPLLSWLDSGIDANTLAFFSVLDDGRIAAATYGETHRNSDMELSLLTAADASTLPPKITLTYGTMLLNPSERKAIVAFNNTSDKYFISVKEYADGVSHENGLLRLSTDIAAGNIPDILHVSTSIPVRRYGAAGILEDLWPYIDNDPEITREDLMERVLHALEQDGKLFQISDTFHIATLVGAKEVVGDRMTWTKEDVWTALAAMPEGCGVMEGGSRNTILKKLLALNADRLIDWNAGTCCFDSDEFRSMLLFCSQFPDEDTPFLDEQGVGVYLGEQMLLPASLDSFDRIKEYQTLFGGEISYIGYPNVWGQVGSSFGIYRGLAMSSACKDKEGAWSFMRTLLLPSLDDENRYTNFFINKADFARSVENALTPVMKTDRNGQTVEVPRWSVRFDCGDFTIEFKYNAVAQEQYDQIIDLYNAVDTAYWEDNDLWRIVSEPTQAYFAGDKTIDEVVELIQNRAELYVNERL